MILDVDRIRMREDTYIEAYNSKDFDTLASLHTEDCKLLPGTADVIAGRDGIKEQVTPEY